MEFMQLLLSGLANGCVYGLVALGFVLIYKATEAINFAQGDFMMLGAFVMIGLVNPQYMARRKGAPRPASISAMRTPQTTVV